MRIERIHRWQWIGIGLVLGFLVGAVRNRYSAEDVSGYGNSMNGQEQFESAILTRERISESETRPLFYKLVVFRVIDPTATQLSREDMLARLTPQQKKEHDAIK